MHRLRLSTLLMSFNAGLLLLAIAAVAIAAVNLLQQQADAQALARVKQAAAIGQQLVRSAHDDTLTSAQLLAERPTLRRHLASNDLASLQDFIAQFERTGQLDGVAVMQGGQNLVRRGDTLPTELTSSGDARFIAAAPDGTMLLGARSPVDDLPAASVLVVRRLDAAFARDLSERIGLAVSIHNPDLLLNQEPEGALDTRAPNAGDIVSRRIGDAYVVVAALPSMNGVSAGVLRVELPAAGVAGAVRQLVATLLLVALTVATVAALVSYVVGRRLGRPLGVLTSAAARIGQGDLDSPVALAPGAEIGTLAQTLEEMRRRLLRLTGDLRREQAEAQAIVTGIVEGVYGVDRDRRIRYINPQAAAMLGTTSEAAIGRFCGDVLHPESNGGGKLPCAEDCPIVHARFRGGARATEQLRLPNGERRTVVITSAPAVDGRQMQVLRDETEVEATRRTRDAILANISHEFRTPLSAQLASIELLLEQLPELDLRQIEQLVRSQQRGTLRLMHLIDNLLESARIEAGQHVIRRRRVALDEVVEEALELIRPLLDQRAQAVSIDLSYPLPPVYGDAPRLIQVFVNLLGNANKWAPAGSTIEIGSRVNGESVMLWVEDDGPGLSETTGHGLFRRFVRSSQDEPEQQGVGLGLWLVKSIVERHGGHVEAHNTGHGTRMSVVLPTGEYA